MRPTKSRRAKVTSSLRAGRWTSALGRSNELLRLRTATDEHGTWTVEVSWLAAYRVRVLDAEGNNRQVFSLPTSVGNWRQARRRIAVLLPLHGYTLV